MGNRVWLALGLALAAGVVGAQELSILGSGDVLGGGEFRPAQEILFGVDPRRGLRPWVVNRFLDRGEGIATETEAGAPRLDPGRDVLPLTNGGSAVNPGGSCWGIVSLQSAFHQYFQQGKALPEELTASVPELRALIDRAGELGHCGLRELVAADPRSSELAQVAAGKLMASQGGFRMPAPALDADALAAALARDGYAMLAFAMPPKSSWWGLGGKSYGTHAVQVYGAPRRVELTGPGGRRATGTFFPVADSNADWSGGRGNPEFGLVKFYGVTDAKRMWTWVGASVGRQRLCQDCYQPDDFYQDAALLWLVPSRFWESGARDRSGRPAADYIWSRPAGEARAD